MKPTIEQLTVRLLGGIPATDQAILDAYGKTIDEMVFFSDTLHITFTDDWKLSLTHDTADCCASKYLVCDDDMAFAKGARFLRAVIKDAPDINDGAECHEVQFAEIVTTAGSITLAAHNEHSGYYGGIGFNATLKKIAP